MAAKKLRRARLSQELCERLSRHQITTCQVKELFYVWGSVFFGGGVFLVFFEGWVGLVFNACTVYFFVVLIYRELYFIESRGHFGLHLACCL